MNWLDVRKLSRDWALNAQQLRSRLMKMMMARVKRKREAVVEVHSVDVVVAADDDDHLPTRINQIFVSWDATEAVELER
jgi:hypothetical protein